MTLHRQLLVTIAGLLLGMAAASLFGLYHLNLVLSVYETEVQARTDQERTTTELLLKFRTRTQEWKNTLLRGQDAQARAKHWDAFRKLSADIDTRARQLSASLPEGEGRSLVSRFAEANVGMDKAYGAAYVAFEQAGFDAAVGDKAVHGVDRGPAKLLDDAAESIAATAAAAAADAAQAGRRAARISLACMLAVAAAGAALAVTVSRNIVRRLGADPADLAAFARQVAAGDLVTAPTKAHGDDSSVVSLLGRMQAALAEVVLSVRKNSESVAAASAQVAQGNLDLSQRTEEQASALQQTAATMAHLASTVRNNTESAGHATRLARDASAIAGQGGEVVDKVVTTMNGISESSRRIGDIIGVIEGIAFQTNILALNASVEAARAGEQGRGFAVVASEVRNLAQRSASAAKEIRALIGSSGKQVEQGSLLADQAGKTMGEIVASIGRVSDIVAAISSANVEQSTGIEQICETITRMDGVTQQNAALVEESAAAAESLNDQARQLVRTVAAFKLAHDPAAS